MTNNLVVSSSSIYRICMLAYNELAKGKYGEDNVKMIENRCMDLIAASSLRVSVDSYSTLWIFDTTFRQIFKETLSQTKDKYIFIYNVIHTLASIIDTVDKGGLNNASQYIFVSEPL